MNIIEMGIQAGLCDEEGRDDNSIIIEDHLERFAKLAAAHEREACAKIVEDLFVPPDEIVDFIVEKIMARGKV